MRRRRSMGWTAGRAAASVTSVRALPAPIRTPHALLASALPTPVFQRLAATDAGARPAAEPRARRVRGRAAAHGAAARREARAPTEHTVQALLVGGPRAAEPRAVAQHVSLFMRALPVLANARSVLADGVHLNADRARWQAQAQGSLGNTRTRNYAKVRSTRAGRRADQAPRARRSPRRAGRAADAVRPLRGRRRGRSVRACLARAPPPVGLFPLALSQHVKRVTHAEPLNGSHARTQSGGLATLTPATTVPSPVAPAEAAAAAAAAGVKPDLDTPDELAAHAVLLGFVHRAAGHLGASHAFLKTRLRVTLAPGATVTCGRSNNAFTAGYAHFANRRGTGPMVRPAHLHACTSAGGGWRGRTNVRVWA
jgi:hypothetical protein